MSGERMDMLIPYTEEGKAAMAEMAELWFAGQLCRRSW